MFEMMLKENRIHGTTFLVVTHNMELARRCHRIVEVIDGRVSDSNEKSAHQKAADYTRR